MKKLIAMMMALVMLFALCACGQQPTGGSSAAPAADSGAAKDQGQAAAPAAEKETKKEETRYWTFATPPTTSALYSFCVGLGQAIQADMPEYQITISECTGAVQITKLVRQGNAMIGNSVSSTDYENYMGIGDFDGNPGTESRMLWYYENTPLQLVVSEASGINTLSDLQGKKFNPGGTTTSAESLTFKIMETLGIEPDFFIAGQADAGDAYSSRQIDGIVKAGPAGDSFVVQLNAAVPVKILSLSDEEMAKVLEALPYVVECTIPAGSYDGIDYDVHTIMTMMGTQTTTAMSQEDGYKLINSYLGNAKAAVDAAYPLGANNDIIALTLSSPIPLHAGTVQYLVEKGIDVPAELIPPEYVPVG